MFIASGLVYIWEFVVSFNGRLGPGDILDRFLQNSTFQYEIVKFKLKKYYTDFACMFSSGVNKLVICKFTISIII